MRALWWIGVLLTSIAASALAEAPPSASAPSAAASGSAAPGSDASKATFVVKHEFGADVDLTFSAGGAVVGTLHVAEGKTATFAAPAGRVRWQASWGTDPCEGGGDEPNMTVDVRPGDSVSLHCWQSGRMGMCCAFDGKKSGGAGTPPAGDAEIAAFLGALDDAIARKDVAFVAAHVAFPLKAGLGGESHASVTLKNATEMIARSASVRIDAAFLAAAVAHADTVGQGVVDFDKCRSGPSDGVDWSRGDKAIHREARQATVRYLDAGCWPQGSGMVTLRLRLGAKGWILAARERP